MMMRMGGDPSSNYINNPFQPHINNDSDDYIDGTFDQYDQINNVNENITNHKWNNSITHSTSISRRCYTIRQSLEAKASKLKNSPRRKRRQHYYYKQIQKRLCAINKRINKSDLYHGLTKNYDKSISEQIRKEIFNIITKVKERRGIHTAIGLKDILIKYQKQIGKHAYDKGVVKDVKYSIKVPEDTKPIRINIEENLYYKKNVLKKQSNNY